MFIDSNGYDNVQDNVQTKKSQRRHWLNVDNYTVILETMIIESDQTCSVNRELMTTPRTQNHAQGTFP